MAVGVAQPFSPPGIGMELTHHYADGPAGGDVRRASGADPGQAELGLRAGERPAAVGSRDRAGVAVAGQAVGADPVAGRRPGALRPALRGPRPRRRRRGPRRRARPDRADRRRRWQPDGPRCDGPTAATSSRSRSTTSSRRPASSTPLLRPARRSAARRQRPRPAAAQSRRGGRARPCPASTSPARSGRPPRAWRSTACRANSGAVHGARYNARGAGAPDGRGPLRQAGRPAP